MRAEEAKRLRSEIVYKGDYIVVEVLEILESIYILS